MSIKTRISTSFALHLHTARAVVFAFLADGILRIAHAVYTSLDDVSVAAEAAADAAKTASLEQARDDLAASVVAAKAALIKAQNDLADQWDEIDTLEEAYAYAVEAVSTHTASLRQFFNESTD